MINLAAEPKHTQIPMKKLLSFTFAIALSVTIISCGQSKEEKTADSLQVDSIAKGSDDDANHFIDSINRTDSMNNVITLRIGDSLRHVREVDSIAKLKKKK